jgi:hypothetical protein
MAITGNYTPAPAAVKQAAPGNYLDFTGGADATGINDWRQQYLPDLVAKESEVFGNRSVAGFLSKVGAEEAMAADQVVWSEQGRLHLSYQGDISGETIVIDKDTDGTAVTGQCGVRAGDMIVVSDATHTAKCFVISVSGLTLTVKPYTAADLAGASLSGEVQVMVFGSEYVKGSVGRDSVNTPGFKSFSNNPIILKDKYEVSGSDASQVGWVEVTGEEGQNGYLWYLKASGDTRARFNDYLEMAMIESEKATGTAPAATQTDATGDIKGTEGLFAAINDRGNTTADALSMVTFDLILKEFDKNGAIEENMMFLDRTEALAVDDMLAGMNNYGADGGTSYGVFDNDADMAINLGFSGFRRGSYDFYKSDWKYLNDLATRGIINADNSAAVRGVIIPAGVSSVYDQSLGKNLKRPFLHVRYRASQTESRKYKTWTTGSVGAVTSDLDMMEMHYLSERCLVVQGANNFLLLN